jgi:hypothetical protein
MANQPDAKKFELDQNDRRTVRALQIDQANTTFQEEYTRSRELWQRAGFKGGLYNATLFSMAMRFPIIVEKPVPIPKRQTPKKQLAKA